MGHAAERLLSTAVRLTLVAGTGALLSSGLAAQAWRHADLAADLGASPAAVGPVVTAAVLALGAATAAWYALTALFGLAAALGRQGERTRRLLRRWGAPLLRQAVAGVAVAGTLSVLAPANAATPASTTTDAREDLPVDLGWGAWEPGDGTGSSPRTPPGHELPPSPTPTATPATDAPGVSGPTPTVTPATDAPGVSGPMPIVTPATDAPPAGPLQGAPPPTYRVVPGDSLWSIAAAHLGPGADAAAVAAAWPRWYQTNRDVVGPDPDLIHPGQLLSPPSKEAPR